eukprot:3818947-Pyramimonas_sp.AAC.1
MGRGTSSDVSADALFTHLCALSLAGAAQIQKAKGKVDSVLGEIVSCVLRADPSGTPKSGQLRQAFVRFDGFFQSKFSAAAKKTAQEWAEKESAAVRAALQKRNKTGRSAEHRASDGLRRIPSPRPGHGRGCPGPLG